MRESEAQVHALARTLAAGIGISLPAPRALTAAGGGRLERLDLRCCGITDEGNEALAGWLASPACRLRECLLFGNDSTPGARGTTALGVAIMGGAVRCATDLKPCALRACGAAALRHCPHDASIS